MVKKYLVAWSWIAKDKLLLSAPLVLHYLLFNFADIIVKLFPKKGLDLIMRMNRYTDHNLWDSVINRNFNKILNRVGSMAPKSYALNNYKEMCERRSLIVKVPRKERGKTVEKGVLLLTFTSTFDYYFHLVQIDRLLNDFYIVIEPSWAGYCDDSILQWSKFYKHKIVVQSSEVKDRIFLNTLNSNLIAVDFGASDWVDFRIFHLIPDVEKCYDSIYVTNYKPGKRHHVYLRAIAKIGDPSYRGAMACGRWGKAKKKVLDLIRYYGVENNIDIYESLPQHDLNKLLNKAKVNVLFSKKEGSNRSIFEAFFANVPAIVLKNNIGMNKGYINKYTGMLVDEKEVCNALLYFREKWGKFRPREWAMENISPLKTTEKLNSILKTISSEEGLEWKTNIVPKVNCPEVEYFDQCDKNRFISSERLLYQYS